MVGREQPASGIHLHTCDPARTSRTVDSDRVLSCTAVFDLTRYLQLYPGPRNCQLPLIDIVTSLLTAESAFSVPAARTMAFICICVNIGGFVWTDGLIKKYKRFLKRQKLQ